MVKMKMNETFPFAAACIVFWFRFVFNVCLNCVSFLTAKIQGADEEVCFHLLCIGAGNFKVAILEFCLWLSFYFGIFFITYASVG
jgi:hypothetical protein